MPVTRGDVTAIVVILGAHYPHPRRNAANGETNLSQCQVGGCRQFWLPGNLTSAPVTENEAKQMREAPMTSAGQTFLLAGDLFCLSFAAIALVYFADRLRSGFLGKP
jgi:hypothetical protein